jgi:hypothetical protein
MTLAQYRAWRDRELWTNEYNALRKRKLMGEAISSEEEKVMQDLEKKLGDSGGIPPPSKALLQMKEVKE